MERFPNSINKLQNNMPTMILFRPIFKEYIFMVVLRRGFFPRICKRLLTKASFDERNYGSGDP